MANWFDSVIGFISPEAGIRRAAARDALASYKSAVPTRLDRAWPTVNGAPLFSNSLSNGNQKKLRDRARHLCDNNPIASGMIERATDNIVGPEGIKPQAQTEDAKWNERAEALWNNWTPTANVGGITWQETQRLTVSSWLRDGDNGTALLQSGKIQSIEAESIANPPGENDESIIDGIELTEANAPKTFFISQWEGTKQVESAKFKAKDFIFLANRKSVNQVRGEPCFAPCMDVFDQLKDWQDASLTAAKIAAYMAIVLKTKNPAQQVKRTRKTAGQDGTEQREMPTFEPGTIANIYDDESIETLESKQPNQNFPDFFRVNVQTLGLPLGLPIELTLLDFKNTNFSSSRASLLQAHKAFETKQRLFTTVWLQRIWQWRVSKWMKEIDPETGKTYLPYRDDAWNVRWVAPPWPFLNPLQEIQAMAMRIDMGLETLTGALAAQGIDIENYIKTRGGEISKLRAAGIPLVHYNAMQPYDETKLPPALPTTDDPLIADEGEENE